MGLLPVSHEATPAMHTVTDILRAGTWSPQTAADRIVLDFD